MDIILFLTSIIGIIIILGFFSDLRDQVRKEIPSLPSNNTKSPPPSTSPQPKIEEKVNENQDVILEKEKKLIVCMDGGGMRGLITIFMLDYLYDALHKIDITENADMICGTSTGSLLSLGKAKRVPNQKLKELYLDVGNVVFSNPLKNMMYNGAIANQDALKKEIIKIFGRDVPLKKFETSKKLFVTSCQVDHNFKGLYLPVLFTNYNFKDDKFKDVTVVESLLSSSAAPCYFNPVQINGYYHADGGLHYNNPVDHAFFEAKTLWPLKNYDYIIVSLGTGYLETPIPIKSSKKVATPKNNSTILTNYSKSSSNSSTMIKTLKEKIANSHEQHKNFQRTVYGDERVHYFRFDPPLEHNISLNDTSQENVDLMRKTVIDYFKKKGVLEMVHQLVDLLPKKTPHA